MQQEQPVKVLFRYYSKVLEHETIETMWATVVDEKNGLYKLDSIPFYGPEIASDDIFFAEFDKGEKMLTFREVRQPSGNSIVQIILMNETFDTKEFQEKLIELGCVFEGLNEKYFAVEIPASQNYLPIKDFFNKLKETGSIDYAEPMLSDRHSY
jgi:hypothetical protein